MEKGKDEEEEDGRRRARKEMGRREWSGQRKGKRRKIKRKTR